MQPDRRILIVLTSHTELGDDRRTGYHVGEAAEAWLVFEQAGFAVDVASVAGGEPRPDAYDPGDDLQRRFVRRVESARVPAVAEIRADDYDAIYLSGGHGTMWDFRTPAVSGLVSAAYQAGLVVSAVCHGPAGLLDATDADGRRLLRGRAVTGFSNDEERAVGLTETVPFLLRDELVAAGADHRQVEPFGEHVVVDGRLVTGQNPASAHATAHAVLDVLSAARQETRPPEGRRVWLVTGASAGFGREISRQALAAGDAVVATARDTTGLVERLDIGSAGPAATAATADPAATGRPNEPGSNLATARLDVTDPRSIRSAVHGALARFGRIDVLVNNAGYGLRGATEEWDLDELALQFETNVFGVLRVTRAVLPTMRSQGAGHILQMSSVGGVVSTLGGTAYAGSKFALEGLSEGLAAEVAGFGIRVTLVEPGPFRTDFAGRSTRWSRSLPAYRELLADPYESFRGQDGRQPNDPELAARILVDLTRMAEPPLRLPLGPESFERIRQRHLDRLEELEQVRRIGHETGYRDPKSA